MTSQSTPSPPSHPQVSATYTSPTSGTQSFTLPLETTTTTTTTTNPSTTASKTNYLSDLRAKTKQFQEQVNAFLTDKMAEDKARHAQAAQHPQSDSHADGKLRDEVDEEEKYGEEVPEDDP